MKFFTKLAMTNIKNNKKIYVPYLLTCVFTISLHYIISCLTVNKGITGHDTITTFMELGRVVIIIFSFIFLLYTNGFIIKRRKKEIGVYNVLGMEKKHIMIMMFIEMLIITCLSLVSGIVLGIILDKLVYMLLTYIVQLNSGFVFEVPISSLIQTIMVFGIIFFVSLLFNLLQVKISNPVELIKGGQVGEKEPKTKLFMTIIGILCLGSGYYIAVTIEDPMTAIMIFFGAVILIMIGTYCLFTAGSIALLKLLKKNRRFYYQTNHFISVSSMIYRMKQNAVGLANICILCTCVLVTLSSTICIYVGIDESVNKQCPSDFYIVSEPSQSSNIKKDLIKAADIAGVDYDTIYQLDYKQLVGYNENNKGYLELDQSKVKNISYYNVTAMNIVSQDSYNQAYQKDVDLNDKEVLLFDDADFKGDTVSFENYKYHIVGKIHEKEIMVNNSYVPQTLAIVVSNEEYEKIKEDEHIEARTGVVMDGEMTVQESKDIYSEFTKIAADYPWHSHGAREVVREASYEAYGGLLFIGIFLSIMFMAAAILIIYYKQLTEGYEDQKRFEILQNVGMSQKEVKQSIKSQILIFFFLPLIVAIVHTLFAYPLMLNVLNAFLLGKSSTYVLCLLGCIAGLIIIYGVVYNLTAKTYYKIVKH